jgi:PIN domain nuclease of toxin-antitoxin system
MSGFLVDTHILLWALFEPEKLSPTARQLLSDMDNPVHVSAISLWEIFLKYALGKLHLEDCNPEQLLDAAVKMGVAPLPLAVDEAASFHQLPKLTHKDPFDRMLVRQAIFRGLTLISRDSALVEYRKFGLELVF